MPLIAPKLQAEMEIRILNGLKSAYAANGATSKTAEADWAKLAKAISGIAMDIVLAITTEAQVLPGIVIVASGVGVAPGSPLPVSGATAGPGKIM